MNANMKPLQSLELDDIQVFCRAAESSSFTDASISLGVTPSAVSKAIQRLEKKLKLKLFYRSTRSIRLTEEGRSYYDTCRRSLENIQEIENHLLNNSVPRGTLRISLPDSLAINKLIPMINGFMEKYDETLKMEIFLSTAYVDFMRENFDLAIRIGEVTDLSLVARLYARIEQKIVVSPKYLRKYGTPQSLSDLKNHKCVGLKFPSVSTPLPWKIKGEDALDLNFTMLYNDPFGAVMSVINGYGIIQLLDFTVDHAIANGELVELFPEYRLEPLDIHIVYPSTKYVPAKVRAFIDYLFEHKPLL
ncbi:LysR family transcriptional regulator [Wohlfahrtiimonas larvae]|uniref:LysR family transcriptional regulator n=1 Tax=Wohlfahrtiimonas larvae TaxID=1157986 RepID=A0ABP9MF00_9GAMM|nr:LysR family transcriptional regulator [Wohlfahrtiimonas larvae]